MKAAALIILCFGATIASAGLYGLETTVGEKWWNNNFYLKFNSPCGKTFYIDFLDGTIYREKQHDLPPFLLPIRPVETELPSNDKTELPFISFVSIDWKIYDIHFDYDGVSYIPRLEESKLVYECKSILINHRLDSFVGPNKKVYQVIYNEGNELGLTEKSSEASDHFQIRTIGPYEKWEHTYDFSENGELAMYHTISPIPVSDERSILLPELEPKTFVGENSMYTIVKINTPSGSKYHITNHLNIVRIRSDDVEDVDDGAFIRFTEPNGGTYDIVVDNDHPFLVKTSVNDTHFGKERLFSFVTPNKISYRLDHRNESDHEAPILGSNVDDTMHFGDLEITLVRPEPFYNFYVKYIFSDNGGKLVDRADEIDWTHLNELPAIAVEEVTEEYVMKNHPFLTFYSPNGDNYHIFANQTNTSIVVEKEANNKSQPLYISYVQTNGKKANIYLVSGDHPYLEEEDASPVGNVDPPTSLLVSFATPDQKEYPIKMTLTDDMEWKSYIQLPFQVKEPINLTPASDGLTITIQNINGWQNKYHFTWNGDKLVEASLSPPLGALDNKLLQTLIGK